MDDLKALKLPEFVGTNYTREDMANYIVKQRSKTVSSAEDNILASIKALDDKMTHRFASLEASVVQLRDELAAEREKSRKLETTVDTLIDAVSSQQRYLERLDARDRARNLIMIGVPEDGTDFLGASSDVNKVSAVLQKVKPGTDSITERRLGQARSDGTCRPLLVTLDSDDCRNAILSKCQAGGATNIPGVKLKKDQHPALRKEWRRMFTAEADEKNKPENAGCSIVFDRKKRVLLKDGEVIDRFLPNF